MEQMFFVLAAERCNARYVQLGILSRLEPLSFVQSSTRDQAESKTVVRITLLLNPRCLATSGSAPSLRGAQHYKPSSLGTAFLVAYHIATKPLIGFLGRVQNNVGSWGS